MKSLNWGLIGPGSIAEEFADALQEVNGSIFGVWGRNLEKANAFAARSNVQNVYEKLDDMLQDERVDVVYISTPHPLHYQFIKSALEHGKHVLCEKAITMNARQLDELIGLATAKGVVLAEAMTLFYMPIYQKLEELIQQGTIGTVKTINVTFGSCKENDSQNRFFNPDLGGGGLLDIGTYALSFARFFLSSQPEELHTTVKKHETGVDEQSGIILKTEQQELAVISLAMRAKMPKRGIVAGDLGFITVDDFPRADRATITYTATGEVETIEAGDSSKALQYEIERMTELIAQPQTNWAMALSVDVMHLMDKTRENWNLSYELE
ncbi:Gfo/Idh/MocA family protein [Planococcus maritimus]|uniref:Gfo/Idh/MocA family protein n=1 Tax=Planococcus maritimus TaxID=192421 RepID=UPI0007953854|nr:Gfo/Idh/MocA family oxidoreductase [Planococcus maritimus]KYG58412.1 oxidoreductase [Planococcus maritimus]